VESRLIFRRRSASRATYLIGAPVNNVVNRTVIAVDLRTGNCSRISGASAGRMRVYQLQFEA
jgi:hypothetical protein